MGNISQQLFNPITKVDFRRYDTMPFLDNYQQCKKKSGLAILIIYKRKIQFVINFQM
jgi:hypothetical protein